MSKKRRQVKKSKSARKRANSRAARLGARRPGGRHQRAQDGQGARRGNGRGATLPSVRTIRDLQAMLKVLRDRKEHIKVRLAALAVAAGGQLQRGRLRIVPQRLSPPPCAR